MSEISGDLPQSADDTNFDRALTTLDLLIASLATLRPAISEGSRLIQMDVSPDLVGRLQEARALLVSLAGSPKNSLSPVRDGMLAEETGDTHPMLVEKAQPQATIVMTTDAVSFEEFLDWRVERSGLDARRGNPTGIGQRRSTGPVSVAEANQQEAGRDGISAVGQPVRRPRPILPVPPPRE